MKTILQIRRAAIAKLIDKEIKEYLAIHLEGKKVFWRRCATTGKLFKPRHRYHFFSSPEARKEFYRGQFKPRD